MPAASEADSTDRRTGSRGLSGRESILLAGLVLVLAAILVIIAVAVPDSRSAETSGARDATSATPDPYLAQRRQGVQRLLDGWAAALRSGDPAALDTLFDPRADPVFRAAEHDRAANLRDVPLADWGFEIGDDPETPVPADVFTALDASDAWYPTVWLRYAVDGPDATSTRKPVSLTVARHGDDWYLVSDAPVAGRSTWRGPWDFGPLIGRRVPGPDGRASVVLGHPDQTAEVVALAAEVDDAEAAVSAVWGPDWARAVLVEAAGDQAEFAALAGANRDASQVAAVTVADATDREHDTATGQRIIFSPDAADGLTDETRRSVLRHELTHVAARASTLDGSPMWITEGFADYVGHRGSDQGFDRIAPTLAAAARSGDLPAALPADADFAGARAVLAYEWAWSVNAFVADEFGEPALTALYRALSDGPADPEQIDAATRDVLGVGAGELIDRWRAWVTRQVS
ncbi:hypothetical protein OG921_22525 [Aldersonia sp. NBC_00410]|uniref:hypothetical protein n=1 Tax=Aldersonia sp. NBC_00410 TaxID=2975954 RepID=UPI00224E79F8|nr:hypothetical protein [Aldersonia sp. NBC_00410]MCX5045949.1 hypothetical protein [Aldersonia sp. NBC_00410]